MRLTLVTETFAPQVNGVSRTLGQLVDHLERSGDSVQVVHPDYGRPLRPAPTTIRSGSWVLPFYREVSVPLPPFGRVHRAIEAFRPDLIHVATEITLGLSALRHGHRRVGSRSSPASTPTSTSIATTTDWAGPRGRPGDTSGGSTTGPWKPTSRRGSRSPTSEAEGFERLVLWPRGVDGTLFRPDRSGRAKVRQSLGFGPDDVVIGHVSRLAAEKNVMHLAEALRAVGRARPEVKFLFVGDGPARPELEAQMGPNARFVGYQSGRGPGRPLRLGRSLRLRQPDRDVRQRRARSPRLGPAGGRHPRGGRG